MFRYSLPLRYRQATFLLAQFVFFLAVFLLMVGFNLHKEINHDEHLYVSGGKMLAHSPLVLYEELPFLQMPNLVFVYAGLFKITGQALLSARIFSTACALIGLGIIFYTAVSLFSRRSYTLRFLVGAGAVALLITNPIFSYTSGLAWNHDLPVLLALLAFLAYSRGLARPDAGQWMLLTGVLLGHAVGTRLTFATLLVPFVLTTLIYAGAGDTARKLRLLTLLGVGVIGALLPFAALLALAPGQTVFGNLLYHQLNAEYWQVAGYERAMTVLGKLDYLWSVLQEPGNLTLVSLFVLMLVAAWRLGGLRSLRWSPRLLLLMLILPALLLGSFGPTPSWYQYFFAPVPFLVVGALHALGIAASRPRKLQPALLLFAGMVIGSCALAVPRLARLENTLSPQKWTSSTAHSLGGEIRRAVGGGGSVLTLAPLFPLEGGASIYREFVTGPFTWRVASLVPPGERRKLQIVSAGDLNGLLDGKAPDAILVGYEPGLEGPLLTYAAANCYLPSALSNGSILWLKPSQNIALR